MQDMWHECIKFLQTRPQIDQAKEWQNTLTALAQHFSDYIWHAEHYPVHYQLQQKYKPFAKEIEHCSITVLNANPQQHQECQIVLNVHAKFLQIDSTLSPNKWQLRIRWMQESHVMIVWNGIDAAECKWTEGAWYSLQQYLQFERIPMDKFTAIMCELFLLHHDKNAQYMLPAMLLFLSWSTLEDEEPPKKKMKLSWCYWLLLLCKYFS